MSRCISQLFQGWGHQPRTLVCVVKATDPQSSETSSRSHLSSSLCPKVQKWVFLQWSLPVCLSCRELLSQVTANQVAENSPMSPRMVLEVRVGGQFLWVKVKGQQGHAPTGGPRGESISCLFPFLEAPVPPPWLLAPCSVKASSAASSSLSLLSLHVTFSSVVKPPSPTL